MSNTSKADGVLIAVPMLASFITSYFAGKIKTEPDRAWFQPPGWVFFVAWTVIYIMFGFLLYESKRQEDYFTLGLVIGILVLTYSWQIIYNRLGLTKLALYVIFLTLILGLILFVQLFYSKIVKDTKFGEGYIMIYVPFLAWILFALLLSIHGRGSNFKTKPLAY